MTQDNTGTEPAWMKRALAAADAIRQQEVTLRGLAEHTRDADQFLRWAVNEVRKAHALPPRGECRCAVLEQGINEVLMTANCYDYSEQYPDPSDPPQTTEVLLQNQRCLTHQMISELFATLDKAAGTHGCNCGGGKGRPSTLPAMDAAWVAWAEKASDQLRHNEDAVAAMPQLAITNDVVVENLEHLAEQLHAWELVGPNRQRWAPGDGTPAGVNAEQVEQAAAAALENVIGTAWVILWHAADAQRRNAAEVAP